MEDHVGGEGRIGLAALGYALYLRYLVIEQTAVSLPCEAGLATWLCFSRKVMITLFQHWVFGAIAIGAALLNLIRPSLMLFAIGITASALGIYPRPPRTPGVPLPACAVPGGRAAERLA